MLFRCGPLLTLIALLLGGCASSSTRPADQAAGTMPAFPDGRAASFSSRVREGSDTAEHTWQNVFTLNGDLWFYSGLGGGISYARYDFFINDEQPTALRVELNEAETSEAWFAVADYGEDRWKILGPASADATFFLPRSAVSPQGSVSVVFLVYGDDRAWIERLELITDGVNMLPRPTIEASATVGAPGMPITLDAGASMDPNGYITRYEWDLDGDGTFEFDAGLATQTQTTLPTPTGRRTVALRVTDNILHTAIARQTLSSSAAVVDPRGGKWCSLAIIDGHPAVTYTYYEGETLHQFCYSRALDAQGKQWGAPVVLTSEFVLGYNTLAEINGRPAVAYEHYLELDPIGVAYCSALDSTGNQWGEEVNISTNGSMGGMQALAEVDGMPAIALYTHDPSYRVNFVRAADEFGQSWGTPVSIDTGANYGQISLDVVGGKPALCYSKNSPYTVHYAQSGDAQGSRWRTTQAVVSSTSGPLYQSMMELDGLPALIALETTNTQPPATGYIFGGTDASGRSWNKLTSFPRLPQLWTLPVYPALTDLLGQPLAAYSALDTLSVIYPQGSKGWKQKTVDYGLLGSDMNTVMVAVPGGLGFIGFNPDGMIFDRVPLSEF